MERDISFKLICERTTKDSTGQTIPDGAPFKRPCIGSLKSLTQSEFYKASQAGFQPEGVIKMNSAEYKGETLIEIRGHEYTIYRTYENDFDWIEVYYGKRVGN